MADSVVASFVKGQMFYLAVRGSADGAVSFNLVISFHHCHCSVMQLPHDFHAAVLTPEFPNTNQKMLYSKENGLTISFIFTFRGSVSSFRV